MTRHIGWSEPRVALLRKGWAEGLSASQIARQLGGTTRNAVIGKVHRLGLAGRATQYKATTKRAIRERRRAVPKVQRYSRIVAPSDPASLLPIDETLGIQGLTNFTCRYPIGDPQDAEFSFCGRACNNIENPYCVQHQRLAYVPAQKKKRKHDETARLANWMDRRTFQAAA